MNINLIREKHDLKEVRASDRFVVETYRFQDGARNLIKIYIYDPDINSYWEVMPEIFKYEGLPVYNCMWESPYVFFASISSADETALELYRYDIFARKCSKVAVLDNQLIGMLKEDRIKIFAFDAAFFLIQIEKLQITDADSGKGKLTFEQKLINFDTGEEVAVVDPNLVNNGVNIVTALSSTHIMVKTGYSHLEDGRLRPGVEEEALIESVYYGPLTQFITAVGMESGTTGYTMLGTAYLEKNISAVKAEEDYIHFNIVDLKEKNSETIFYNYKTDETFRAHSIGLDDHDPETAFVADNIPFVRQDLDDAVRLINIKTSRSDSMFYEDKITGNIGKLIILNKKRGQKNYIRAYAFPGLELAFEQQGHYTGGCINGSEYYIYYRD